ncbi:MAG: hypothetical protein OEY67_04050 [Gammaproteobacteria bacterium]|nr:hypothetical protein [Gammaproteobacteria bacterium]
MTTENSNINEESRRKNRTTLILIAAVCILPVALAYGLNKMGWKPDQFGNYGELVQPALPLKEATLSLQSGETVSLKQLHHKWLLIAFSDAGCNQACLANMDKMKRLQIAQAKNQDRIQRILVLAGRNFGNQPLPDFLTSDRDLKIVVGPQTGIVSLLNDFSHNGETPLEDANRIYLVDPLGNLILRYPADADASKMHKDLARLLRVSRVG